MKMAKSYKIIILFTAFVMSLVLAIGGFSVNKANAFTVPTSVSSYLENVSSENVAFNAESLDITLTESSNKFSFKQLVIDDFEMKFSVEGATALSMELGYASHLVNGVEKDGKFVKNITNKFDIDKTGEMVVGIIVNNDGFPIVTVDGEELAGEYDDYYKIGFTDKPVAKITFVVETEEQAKFSLVYVDQKASDDTDNYKQTFESEDGKLKDSDTYPRVSLDNSFFTKKQNGEVEIIKSVTKLYTPTFSAYSVLNNVKSSDVYFVRPEGSDVQFNTDSTKPKKILFPSVGEVEFAVTASGLEEGEYVEKYTATVVDPENSTDDTAPVYVENEQALNAFKEALKEAVLDGDHYIALGTELDIPSLEDLVFDDQTPYEDLSVKVYYKSASESLTSDDLSFEVNEAGKYTFYVLFTDMAGNAMEATDFVDKDDNGNQYIVEEKYGAFVFDFYISDNAPIKVEAPASNGIGFTGVKFTSPSFDVDANGCKTTYKLYYNTNKEATVPESKEELNSGNWIEIPKASSVTNKDYDKDGFTYDEIKAIGYDGELTFTPNAIGSYLIECTATSEVTHRSDTDYSVVNVKGAPQTVKVPSNWLQNNVWSVVFLSLGTLCLIGIVILLFIKPKDETEGD